jgi:hypothetical protein
MDTYVFIKPRPYYAIITGAVMIKRGQLIRFACGSNWNHATYSSMECQSRIESYNVSHNTIMIVLEIINENNNTQWARFKVLTSDQMVVWMFDRLIWFEQVQ